MRLFFLLLAGVLAACTPAPSTSMPTTATPTGPASHAYLTLGDSYTIGEGATEADRWPVQLAAMLREQGLGIANPAIIARTGWTTSELQDAIRASGNHRTDYELVSLLIGVNNQYRGQSIAVYRAEFRELLATAQRYAGGRAYRVLVLSIPDWGFTPFAEGQDRARIGHAIDEFNAVARQECQQAGIAFVNITPLTRDIGSDPTQFTADGLHYSGAQMRRWAEAARPTAYGLLSNDGRYTGATH